MRILIFLVLVLSFNVSWAGYDKTDWGMSVSKVQALYPGGVIEKLQNGETIYGLVQPIGGLSTGLLNFIFQPKKGLKKVTIHFPKQGTTVNLKTGDFIATSGEECNSIFNILNENLKTKYGAPNLEKDETINWATENKDWVMLLKTRSTPKDLNCTVSIGYSKIADDSSTKGL